MAVVHEQERKAWQEDHRYYGRSMAEQGMEPKQQVEQQTLFTILNDDEFNAVRMAVLKEMDVMKEPS